MNKKFFEKFFKKCLTNNNSFDKLIIAEGQKIKTKWRKKKCIILFILVTLTLVGNARKLVRIAERASLSTSK